MEQRKQEEYAEENWMQITFAAKSENEGFARVSVASFLTQLNPTVEEVADVKTAVSEAVTNAIIHGYEQRVETVRIHCSIENQLFTVEISDRGKGIANVEKAMEPMFTTKPEDDRSGMGFSFMEAFMDELEVQSKVQKGTTIIMKKKIGDSSR